MNVDKQKNIAFKYQVDDVAGALVPGTRMSNALNEIENSSSLSKYTLEFLQAKQLFSLIKYAVGELSFDDYSIEAEREKLNRLQVAKAIVIEEENRRKAEEVARQARYELAKRQAKERQKALERDPKYIAKQKQNKLREKYSLTDYIEKECYSRLMNILENVESGKRLNPEDVVWLSIKREEYYSDYFTRELRAAYHRNEASFYMAEYKVKKDPWLAVNASSHYRKCNESKSAITILTKINLDNLNSLKLKSAICTTHGGANRDLKNWTDAIELAEKAHAFTPNDFRPCTLLGAVYIESDNYILGQSWYKKAVERGFSEKSVDEEIKSIYKKLDKSKQESLKKHLLKLDPKRYGWVNKKI